MKPQIFTTYLNIVIAHMRRLDLDVEAILTDAGLGRFAQTPTNNQAGCDFELFLELLHRLETITGNPLFGAEAGRYIHPGDYGKVGLLLMNCETYGHAISMSYRFQHLINNILPRQPYTINHSVYSRINDSGYNAEQIRPYIELEQAALVHISHFITGHMFSQVPVILKFRHLPATTEADYQKIFNCPLRFGCDHNEIKLPAAVMQVPLHNPNADIYSLMLKELKALEQQLGESPDPAQELKIFIRAQMYNTGPLLEKCAALSGTSGSTLKRHLADQGTSYQQIFDEIRFQHSRTLLGKNHCNIAEVANSTGFSSSASFSRSFRKWSGMTPSQYRNQVNV